MPVRFIIVLCSFFLFSCSRQSPRQLKTQQYQREKKLIDSVSITVRQRLQFEDSIRNEIGHKRIRRDSLLNCLQHRYLNLNKELLIQKDRLGRIKTFHFLRTANQREKQLRDQMNIIDALVLGLRHTKDSINAMAVIQ